MSREGAKWMHVSPSVTSAPSADGFFYPQMTQIGADGCVFAVSRLRVRQIEPRRATLTRRHEEAVRRTTPAQSIARERGHLRGPTNGRHKWRPYKNPFSEVIAYARLAAASPRYAMISKIHRFFGTKIPNQDRGYLSPLPPRASRGGRGQGEGGNRLKSISIGK